MKNELPRPLFFGAIALVVILVAGIAFAFFKSSSGDVSSHVVVPKPWGGPPGGFPQKGGVRGAPQSAPPGADQPSKN